MNKIVGVLTVSAFIVLVSAVAFAQEAQSQPAQPEGLKIYLKAKCNLCHSIEAKNVEKASGGFTKVKEKNVPPDLSNVGSKHKAEWLMKYLTKKETNEGVTHSKLFRGSEKDLKTLVQWLETLK